MTLLVIRLPLVWASLKSFMDPALVDVKYSGVLRIKKILHEFVNATYFIFFSTSVGEAGCNGNPKIRKYPRLCPNPEEEQ